MLFGAQQSNIPSTITRKVAPFFHSWVFLLQSTKPQEIHWRKTLDVTLSEDRTSKKLAA
jgi:hypothetical protein